ncbi:diaminopimelate decarboxylase [Lactobacillus helsingborgensis]|uniref:diaminopimelate decarboxylase n=1 Tax=Lactobacillus helsingborgensis TaxID=1218494 RepID=UPI00164FABC8|nr:diaminopimelate decarboxylase [Lactobacillus helsingborgensis]MBC6356893.1 diaminopimelate decarboxylase [Lactobacillus helsingborgensis]
MAANDYYQTNAQGHLVIGGVDALNLAKEFGSPLVVYDVQKIKQQFRAFQNAFAKENVNYAISYASKAFATIAIYQVINELGGHVDVVSGGELYTALQAGFPAARISFHGNNKTAAELLMAVKNHVGVIILDNFTEIKLLGQILQETNSQMQVMLRLTPGVSAHTHEYDQTGQEDSKFGFDIRSGQAEQAFLQVKANAQMELIGLHAHIGSQILETAGFKLEVEKLMQLVKDWQQKYDYQPHVLNLGGGFGIRYTEQDDTLTAQTFISQIVQTVKKCAQISHLKIPAIWIEPGRSIVGEAGYSLYTIGARKEVPGLLPYVAVDGGMGDNIRPALYQAQYEAVLAEKPHAEPVETVRLAGRYCESGDIIINKLKIPKSKPGDVIAVLATGAYGYSMASNYNRVPRPAVVFAENGQAQVVVTRETYADLINHDRFYQPKG